MGFVRRRLEEDAPVAMFCALTTKVEAREPVFVAIEEWGEVGVEGIEGPA
jgi:DNA-binding HxlR family transcriptional regulator